MSKIAFLNSITIQSQNPKQITWDHRILIIKHVQCILSEFGYHNLPNHFKTLMAPWLNSWLIPSRLPPVAPSSTWLPPGLAPWTLSRLTPCLAPSHSICLVIYLLLLWLVPFLAPWLAPPWAMAGSPLAGFFPPFLAQALPAIGFMALGVTWE